MTYLKTEYSLHQSEQEKKNHFKEEYNNLKEVYYISETEMYFVSIFVLNQMKWI